MTENVAPGTAAATDQPGRPYYESLRTQLRGTLSKKKQIDEQLAALEENIYKLETNYLEDTSGAGNIVRGFDNWVKGVVVGGDRRADDRKARGGARVREEDRIFSNSSMTWIRAQDPDASAANTPSHVPTPTSGVPASMKALDSATPGSTTSKSGLMKKKKGAVVEDEDDGKPAKRTKISYGRG